MILFSGSFANEIKNYPLAKAATDLVPQATLLELKGYTREQVCLLMNACDVQLTTSLRESGPLVVKEAMACGTPVVSVDVGDVKELFGDIEGCFIPNNNAEDIAENIRLALKMERKTEGRKRIVDLGLDNKQIAQKLTCIYSQFVA